MKSKQLQKVAMILSCIGLTNLYSTTFEVIAQTLGDERPFINTNLELEDHDIGLAEQAIKDIGQWNPNNPLAQKLFDELNDVTSGKFYNFIPRKIDIEHKTLELGATVAPVTFRVEKIPNYTDMAKIHILEPGIEKSREYVEVKWMDRDNININEGKIYSSWEDLYEDLVDISPNMRVGGCSHWGMTDLNQMPELLHTLNFSRSLAKKTNRTVNDIRGFLGRLDCFGFRVDQMTITKHLEAKHYSLNLISCYLLMAELHFKDESDGAEWYQDTYARYCDDEIFLYTVRDRSFILESITLGTYTYTLTRRVDLLKEHNGVTLLDPRRGNNTIEGRLKTHIMALFSANRIGCEHRNLEEPYSRIDLAKVMQGIEEDFADN